MRKLFILGFFVLSLFAVVSCGKKIQDGPVSVGLIPLTATPTYTPDVNFTLRVHQEETPVQDLEVKLMHTGFGATMTSKTGADGAAYFKVNSSGPWVAIADTFKGFKSQTFAVEPMSNTFFSVNYGIPYLRMDLISGNESLGIAPSTLVYKVTYHTKFERPEEIRIDKKNMFSYSVSDPNTVSKEGDFVTCTINIPKSFEAFYEDRYLNFKAIGNECPGISVFSNERVLTKDWKFNVTVGLHYMQVYAFDDNNRHIVYYAGIKSINASNSYKIPFHGEVKCRIIGARNIGADGTGVFESWGNCVPDYTHFGCFLAVGKIRTSAGLDNNNLSGNNHGEVTVHFYDDKYLSVTRTVKTGSDWVWGKTCAYWCCTSAPLNGVSRVYEYCRRDLKLPFGICQYFWDKPVTADAKREKSGYVNVTR